MVFLNRTPIAIGDLSEELLRMKLVSISSVDFEESVNYVDLLAVARALGPNVKIVALAIHSFKQVEVKAEIYELNAAGETNRLSAPMVTTKAGNEVLIRVVSTESGLKTFPFGADEFHQEDLANLGVRFAVCPQIIGNYVRVSGVVILTKSTRKYSSWRKFPVTVIPSQKPSSRFSWFFRLIWKRSNLRWEK
ncbi:hypothetical protein P4E94_13755 [Pontiellaceae bacterium B12219]|nr:hypothetical protein [Pontiellaceae bacterium B12219]